MLLKVFNDRGTLGLAAAEQAAAAIRRAIAERGYARVIAATAASQLEFLLDGDAADPLEVVRRVGEQLAARPVDIAFLGIGENGHIAFNDPPADFKTEEPYIIVNLDEACRQQQVGEAWFADISQVPKRAISMSARQILKAREILAVVPGPRKAQAVKACFEGVVSPMAPASILRTHPNATVYLDKNSASLLGPALQNGLDQSSLSDESQVTVGP